METAFVDVVKMKKNIIIIIIKELLRSEVHKGFTSKWVTHCMEVTRKAGLFSFRTRDFPLSAASRPAMRHIQSPI